MMGPKRKKVLFAASEVYPFAKSGGLADVAYSLPKAMSDTFDLSVIMPLYQFIDKERFGITSLGENFKLVIGGKNYFAELYGCQYEGIDYFFVYSPLLSDREFLYGPPGSGYDDNAIRFGIFNYAIIDFIGNNQFDLLHLNDWQSALSALLVKQDKNITVKTVYTIHNLAYQGIFAHKALDQLSLSDEYFTMDALEYYGDINLMKAGIAFADSVTTVSPNYAKEILTPEFGNGLDGFLRFYSNKLTGILNGIDSDHFSPDNDKFLVQTYSSKTLKSKAVNKKAYLKEVGLRGVAKPLFVFIGRMTWQKGIAQLIDSLEHLAALPINLAILGEGEVDYQQQLDAIASKHKNIHLYFGYDEALSHQMYAAADFLLMPSRFEPCGLNQMIAMNYGAMPIVHKVGGLKDSVHSINVFNDKSGFGFGITYTKESARSLTKAIMHAIETFEDKKVFTRIIQHNMRSDFSWKKSAKRYAHLYNTLLESEQ